MQIVDLSIWNPYTAAAFSTWHALGARGAMVQLNAGTDSHNPHAQAQIQNSLRYFGWVGAYEYFYGDSIAEAAEFVRMIKHYHLDKTTPIALDIEDNSITGNLTTKANAFLQYCKDRGYKNCYIYSSHYWLTSKINLKRIHAKIWVANPSASTPGIKGAKIFQYTFNWHSQAIDGDICYEPFSNFTGKNLRKKYTHYYHHGSKFKIKASIVHCFADKSFKNRTNKQFVKGNIIKCKAIKFGNIYRLKCKYGYVSANMDWIERIK